MSLLSSTPIEVYPELADLSVKREDMSCGSPALAKARGAYARVQQMTRKGVRTFGALDGYHSRNTWALASACAAYGARCLAFYPNYKKEPGPREAQLRAQELGAELRPLPAGMMSVLWYQARKIVRAEGGHMLPNAMKFTESVAATAAEVGEEEASFEQIIVPSSSATIAAGVIAGVVLRGSSTRVVVYLSHTKKRDPLLKYIRESVHFVTGEDRLPSLHFVEEGYNYREPSRVIRELPFPASPFYEQKAIDWWMREGERLRTLFWNIG
jgi:1-aminocyclopropane-1-carboxylate deaminase/D-cysteine desulfhydrase-like pyridoxal-dependent ACC family enzyme